MFDREDLNDMAKSGIRLLKTIAIVAAIGIIAAIMLPRTNCSLEKQMEGATKGNLSAIRSAISIYYSDHKGIWPEDLTTSFTNYMYPIPPARAKPLGNSNKVTLLKKPPSEPGVGWAYVTDPRDKQCGNVFANSTATDTKGVSFSTY